MTDPEADTRGADPLSDEELDDLRVQDKEIPDRLLGRLIATIDALRAERDEWHKQTDLHFADARAFEARAERAEAAVVIANSKRDEAIARGWRIGSMYDDAQDEVQRLRDELSEALGWKTIAEMRAEERERLRDEVQRLREALEWIVRLDPVVTREGFEMRDIAAAALDREGKTNG